MSNGSIAIDTTGTPSIVITYTAVATTSITFGSATPPPATVGQAYSFQYSATSSSSSDTVTYAVTAGSLPAGLTLSTGGLLSGTPTSQGTSTYTVTATGAPSGATASRQDTVTVNPASADLAVSLSGSPSPVKVNGTLTYTAQISNLGPDPAQIPAFSDTLPSTTTLVSVSMPAVWSCTTPPTGSAGTVACSTTATTWASGSSGTITITVKVGAGAKTLTDTATIGSPTQDPNLANNTSTATTSVRKH